MNRIIDVAAHAGLTHRRVTRAGARRAVSLRREYDFAVDDVWSAWTTPERLARWLGEVRGDIGPGATVELCMSPAAADTATVTIVTCEAPTRLIAQWRWPGEPDSLVDLRLVPVDTARCELVLEHVALDERGAEQYGPGREDLLSHADAFLAGLDPASVDWSALRETVAAPWADAARTAATDPRWPTVEARAADQLLRVSRTVPHEVDAVWAALTSTDAISRWFGETIGDLSVGGRFTVTFDGGSAHGDVRTCEPHRTFTVGWRWDHQEFETEVSVSLASVEAGTEILLEQTGVVGPAKGYAAGWAAYLAAVDHDLAGMPRSEAMWQGEWSMALAMIDA